jgi:hypothetical protein
MRGTFAGGLSRTADSYCSSLHACTDSHADRYPSYTHLNRNDYFDTVADGYANTRTIRVSKAA